MTRTLLIDGDICVYQVSASCERPPIDWGEGVWSSEWADAREAEGRIKHYLEDIMETLKGDAMVIALKDEENWRKDILPTYKAHRAGNRPPMLRAHLMEYLAANYEVYQRPTLEGDDILGILATGTKIKGEKIVVSIDKDLKTIPGKLYNTGKPDDGIVEISERQADYFHMIQTLTGDATDGYKGCPGVGPVKAENILSGCCEVDDPTPEEGLLAMWNAVRMAYLKAKLSEEVALTMARVARICRVQDYDFKKKEVKLWTPPSQSNSVAN